MGKVIDSKIETPEEREYRLFLSDEGNIISGSTPKGAIVNVAAYEEPAGRRNETDRRRANAIVQGGSGWNYIRGRVCGRAPIFTNGPAGWQNRRTYS